MTASLPYTTTQIITIMKDFKYCWVWNKVSVTGFANAKKQPLRCIEDVVVFCKTSTSYNPQGLIEINKKRKNSATDGGASLKSEHLSNNKGSLRTPGLERKQKYTNYPRQLIKISRPSKTVHPTQKPVALMEYLIKTYTNENETVLDFTMGSGTTGVACKNLNRNFIGIEQDPKYYPIAIERILY